MEIRYAYNDFNAQDGPESEADMAGRKQRTPQEIEDEMNEQDQEQAEEVEEDEEEEEGEEEESSAEDESDMLIENYGAFLCLGYSPAQIDKHLPKLIADTAAARVSYTVDMPKNIGEEMAQMVQDAYDEHFLPAFQEFFKELRQKYGTDNVKCKKAMEWLTARMLTNLARYHLDHMTAYPWPKPENG